MKAVISGLPLHLVFRNRFFLLIGLPLVFAACSGGTGKHELTKEEATAVLQQGLHLPDTISYDLYLADPKTAKAVLDAGLEEEGLVSVLRHQKLKDAGKPIVSLTPKSEAYLLPTEPNDYHMQTVSVAVRKINSVTSVTPSEDGTSAEVKYVIGYTDVTPFSKLRKKDYSETENETAIVRFSYGKWELPDPRKPPEFR